MSTLGPRGLRAWAVSRARGPRRARSRGLARHGLGPRLFELLPQDEFQLFRIGDAAEPRELRSQLQILRDEASIFAIEEEADLAKRVDIALVRELHHAGEHLIIWPDPTQAKSA
jgi:hypothetical protein